MRDSRKELKSVRIDQIKTRDLTNLLVFSLTLSNGQQRNLGKKGFTLSHCLRRDIAQWSMEEWE